MSRYHTRLSQQHLSWVSCQGRGANPYKTSQPLATAICGRIYKLLSDRIHGVRGSPGQIQRERYRTWQVLISQLQSHWTPNTKAASRRILTIKATGPAARSA